MAVGCWRRQRSLHYWSHLVLLPTQRLIFRSLSSELQSAKVSYSFSARSQTADSVPRWYYPYFTFLGEIDTHPNILVDIPDAPEKAPERTEQATPVESDPVLEGDILQEKATFAERLEEAEKRAGEPLEGESAKRVGFLLT